MKTDRLASFRWALALAITVAAACGGQTNVYYVTGDAAAGGSGTGGGATGGGATGGSATGGSATGGGATVGGGAAGSVQIGGSAGGLVPTCTDGIKNAQETDVDCGGPSCGKCAANQMCVMEADCEDAVCTNGSCQPANCADAVRNGDETDTDCGGATCPRCGVGKKCLASADCASALCSDNTCAQAPPCADTVKDGAETDTDCGGPTCPKCSPGKACLVNADCTTNWCGPGLCLNADCLDGLKNGYETDTDCGGPICGKCPNGKLCGAASDCLSGSCVDGTCKALVATLKVQHQTPTTTTTTSISPIITIVNTDTASASLPSITVRYWLTLDGLTGTLTDCWYATADCMNVKLALTPITPRTKADAYEQISFTNGTLAPGDFTQINFGMHTPTYVGTYTQTNDYSFRATSGDSALITLYSVPTSHAAPLSSTTDLYASASGA